MTRKTAPAKTIKATYFMTVGGKRTLAGIAFTDGSFLKVSQ